MAQDGSGHGEAVRETAKLGPWLASLLVAGNIVGSGVFMLPATLAVIGQISLVGLLVAALGALLLSVVFSALVVLRPDIDGVADYAHAGLGRYLGFQTGFAYWASNWVGTVAVAVAVTGYLTIFLPALRAPLAAATSTTAVIWAVTLANILGPRMVGRLSGATLAAGLIPILGVAAFGWFWFDPHIFAQGWNVSGTPPLRAIQTSLILVFWAFTGMESGMVVATVVRDPVRNVPIATVAGVAGAAVIYFLALAAIGGIVGAPELAKSSAPFALALGRMLGPAVAGIVAVCALVKVFGTVCGVTLLTAETTRASAATGYFPAVLARVRPDGTPVRALLALAALMTVTVFASMSPNVGRQFAVLIDVSTVLTLVMYGWCALALLRFTPQVASPRWRLGVQAAAILSFAFCAWMILASEPRLLLVSAAILAATVPIWALARLAERARGPKTTAAGAGI